MNHDDTVALARRIDALEKAMIHIKGPQGDPPPDDIGHWRWDLFRRLEDIERILGKFRQIADPPPDDLVHVRSGAVHSRLAELLKFNPGWFSDPPPDDFLNVRVLDLIRRYRGGFTDPAPEDFAHLRLRDLLQRIPGGGFTDPAPDDIGRLTIAELETQLHRIGAEAVRLKSIERVMQERLNDLRTNKK